MGHSSNMLSLKLGFVCVLFILGSEAAPKPKPGEDDCWCPYPYPYDCICNSESNSMSAPQYGDWYMNPNPAPQYGDWYMNGNRGSRCGEGKRFCCKGFDPRFCGCICPA